jgi:hypothetical protein
VWFPARPWVHEAQLNVQPNGRTIDLNVSVFGRRVTAHGTKALVVQCLIGNYFRLVSIRAIADCGVAHHCAKIKSEISRFEHTTCLATMNSYDNEYNVLTFHLLSLLLIP